MENQLDRNKSELEERANQVKNNKEEFLNTLAFSTICGAALGPIGAAFLVAYSSNGSISDHRNLMLDHILLMALPAAMAGGVTGMIMSVPIYAAKIFISDIRDCYNKHF